MKPLSSQLNPITALRPVWALLFPSNPAVSNDHGETRRGPPSDFHANPASQAVVAALAASCTDQVSSSNFCFLHSSRGAYGDAMTVSFSVQTLQFRDPSAQVYSYKHWLVNHSFREEGRWMSMDVVPQVSWRFLLSGLVATSSSALVMSVFNLLLLLFENFFCWASSHHHQIPSPPATEAPTYI